jgi:hypothetical protein
MMMTRTTKETRKWNWSTSPLPKREGKEEKQAPQHCQLRQCPKVIREAEPLPLLQSAVAAFLVAAVFPTGQTQQQGALPARNSSHHNNIIEKGTKVS